MAQNEIPIKKIVLNFSSLHTEDIPKFLCTLKVKFTIKLSLLLLFLITKKVTLFMINSSLQKFKNLFFILANVVQNFNSNVPS